MHIHNVFINSFIKGHLGCSQLWASIKKSIMNIICISDFVCSHALRKIPRRRMVGSYSKQYKALVTSSLQMILCPAMHEQFLHIHILITTQLKTTGVPCYFLVILYAATFLASNTRYLCLPSSQLCLISLGFCQTLPGFFLVSQPGNSITMGRWRHGTHFVYVLYLRDNSLLLPHILYLANHCFIYFVCFFIVSGGKVN